MTAPPGAPPARVVVVGIVRNARGDTLLCRMPEDRGVFPGEWGLPGGGVEPGEIRLSPEFDAVAWASRAELASYALNVATAATFRRMGLLPP